MQSLEGAETREWPVLDSSATCHTVLSPHNSDGSLCYTCTFPGSLWPKLAPILIWFSVQFNPVTRVTPATPYLLCATVHAELDLKPNSRLFLGTPAIALRLTPVLPHNSGPLWPSSGTGHLSASSHGKPVQAHGIHGLPLFLNTACSRSLSPVFRFRNPESVNAANLTRISI